jgi:hypothetical protein
MRYGASRHYRNKKREYLKDKIDEIASYSKNSHCNVEEVSIAK